MAQKWYDKRNRFGGKKFDKKDDRPTTAAPMMTAACAPPTPEPQSQPTATTEDPQVAAWYLKLHELQGFASKGLEASSDGGNRQRQQDVSVLGIMSELGQFAKEMKNPQDAGMKPTIVRRRIGAILVHCAEIAILNGVTLDASVVEKINELCALDKRYERPSSMM